MLKEQIDKDYIEAYKSHDEEKVSVLRMVKSSIKNAEIAKKADLSDDEVMVVLKKEIKQRKESAEAYDKGNSAELANKERSEADLIQSYLPAQLSEEEIRNIVKKTLEENNISDKTKMGQAIGIIMKQYGSQIDGGTVSKIINEELNK